MESAGPARTRETPSSQPQRADGWICADTARQLGLSRSLGQIYGTICASSRPLPFGAVLEASSLSKGPVSQGLRILREFGAIRSVRVDGDRREYFVSEMRMRGVLAAVLRARVKMPSRAGVGRLRAMQRELARHDDPACDVLAQRLHTLRTWHHQALLVPPLV